MFLSLIHIFSAVTKKQRIYCKRLCNGLKQVVLIAGYQFHLSGLITQLSIHSVSACLLYTSFEREGLQAMLQEVEAGRVATVITKDLSRLGRNYLKTGELIEIVFPENGVRYICLLYTSRCV